MTIYRGSDSITGGATVASAEEILAAIAAAEAFANASAASAAEALVSEGLADADAVTTSANVTITNADVVTTNANVLLTNADVLTTNADVVLTGLDVIATNASVVLTNADVVSTAASAAAALVSENNAATSETNAANSAASAAASATYENLDANGDVGTGVGQLAIGNHLHSGIYEPADATILKDADIGVSVAAFSHAHTGVYEPADATILKNANIGSTVQAYDADTAKTDVSQGWSKSQQGVPVAVTFAASIALNLSLGNNFVIGNATSAFTLANPTNVVAGQSGRITVKQDATGGRAIATGSYWKKAGGEALVLSTAANARDSLFYEVQSPTAIDVVVVEGWA